MGEVFGADLVVDSMFEHVDRAYNEDMKSMRVDLFLHEVTLSRSEWTERKDHVSWDWKKERSVTFDAPE